MVTGIAKQAELIARQFHETYEKLAPEMGYKTREASAVPWEDVPDRNRRLMESTVYELLRTNVIDPGREL